MPKPRRAAVAAMLRAIHAMKSRGAAEAKALAVGAFPDGKSDLTPAAARLKCVAESKWGSRRHLDVTPLDE